MLSDDLRRLAAFVEQLEERGVAVEDARPTERDGDVLTVELEVTLTPETDLQRPGASSLEPVETTETTETTDTPPAVDGEGPGDPGDTATDDSEAIAEAEATLVDEDVVVSTEPVPTITSADVPAAADEATAAPEEVSDPAVTVCQHPACDATFGTSHGMKIHYTKVHVTGGDTSEPHRDPEQLREVYEQCDTFEEMRDALGATVTPATVRHHLIEHGIHEPTPNAATTMAAARDSGGEVEASSEAVEREEAETPADDDEASTNDDDEASTNDTEASTNDTEASTDDADQVEERPQEERADDTPATEPEPAVVEVDPEPEPAIVEVEPTADDVEHTKVIDPETEVHEGITVERLIDTVANASTVYEVERSLSLDREETTALLDTLDILEIVHGRVATKPDRDALRAEIDDRIRANVEP